MLEANKRAQPAPTLVSLNDASKDNYMRLIGDVVEHSPWVADQAFASRPFQSIEDLTAKLIACISAAPDDRKIDLFNCHPELAGRDALASTMTESSIGEQGRLGLTRLEPSQQTRLSTINGYYRSKFGFPFIVALKLHSDIESVMRVGEASLNNSREIEISRTIRQISAIVEGRLRKIFSRD